MTGFSLQTLDYVVFAIYFTGLCAVGLWVGRKKKHKADDYFLAGRTLPWYVIGGSFIAANISSEHFIGMVGAAYVFGICVSAQEWGNVWTFSLLIWFFIPRLLSSKVLTTPEFLEKRFHPFLRQFFAVVSIISNIVAALAGVLYGGGLALRELFGWDLTYCIVAIGIASAMWAMYGGLLSVAWTDFFTVIVMVTGGLTVTILGLYMLSGDSHSLVEGWRIMIERNTAKSGVWAEAVAKNAQNIVRMDDYNRLSVIQPITHATNPWPQLLVGWLSVGLWYNVINQYMIQNVLGARNMWHARMGIVLAGFMKILMPAIVVVPGLILFAKAPELLLQPAGVTVKERDQAYIHMLQTLMPAGLLGFFLAALFGAIQSTVTSVLNSTSAMFTMDMYRRWMRRDAPDRHYVNVGIVTTGVILCIAMVLARNIENISKFFGGGLFVYIQTMYAFFAPPFAAIFLLGVLSRRINGPGAIAAVVVGFTAGIFMKIVVAKWPDLLPWLKPYAMQAFVNWLLCVTVCVTVSLLTPRPRPEQVNDDMTINWRKLNITEDLGDRWYNNITLWWALFVLGILALVITFSGRF
ncbi:MAG: SLC5 family protein [Candidatus Sumerlaeaceae bacterium]